MPVTETIDGRPTKGLVAYVLTKDIALGDAVLDLIDNSIDGSRRSKGKRLFEIRVKFDSNAFSIEDNCGGIPYEIARDYAFRFGRPEDLPSIDGPSDLVGNFGVGMKRALLKMGKSILLVSRTSTKYFEIQIDVPAWLADDSNWDFKFREERDEATPDPSLTGTSITVTDLYPGVAERFGQRQFFADVKLAIEEKQAVHLAEGILISVNGHVMAGAAMELLTSKVIKPFRQQLTLDAGDGLVTADIYAGIASKDNDAAGWSIFCNGRAVLRADQSALTGWGNRDDADRIPNFHNQYAMFRGYVFFHADNPDALPWNTAKSSVDAEHPVFRAVQVSMILAMKQVFSFLKDLDRESDSAEQPLKEAVEALRPIALARVKPSATFVFPAGWSGPAPSQAIKWIRYKRLAEKVERAMSELEVSEPSAVGEATFDLWYELNVEE